MTAQGKWLIAVQGRTRTELDSRAALLWPDWTQKNEFQLKPAYEVLMTQAGASSSQW